MGGAKNYRESKQIHQKRIQTLPYFFQQFSFHRCLKNSLEALRKVLNRPVSCILVQSLDQHFLLGFMTSQMIIHLVNKTIKLIINNSYYFIIFHMLIVKLPTFTCIILCDFGANIAESNVWFQNFDN